MFLLLGATVCRGWDHLIEVGVALKNTHRVSAVMHFPHCKTKVKPQHKQPFRQFTFVFISFAHLDKRVAFDITQIFIMHSCECHRKEALVETNARILDLIKVEKRSFKAEFIAEMLLQA